ncbi:hypothetical protein [Curtobacterium sp. MCSS17_016]|uniref:hypothetical protein n=1 Tax=Curtobacterium sp. MCSS17_016 TaxID=2175644 RepID=UPI000DA7A8B6|nr:hypothetical protein [Curtobacterium sp. MCSS17_016]WIE80879.1 hypothetical protein DEJ19_020395 [Curtobacterium sp. MCSS17_016]
MDELLAAAKPHPGISRDELGQQMWLTGYVIVSLFSIAVGIDFTGNGYPGFGHVLTTLGLAALTYLAVESGVRQHRRRRHIDHTGLTTPERAALLSGLALIVVSAAL